MDKQFVIAATVLRVWNDTSLTYRCCPLYWTAMREGSTYPPGCSKQSCPNKEGCSIHRAKVIVLDDTGRATLTLFDQASKELFDTSSDEITRFKDEVGGHSRITSILHEIMNKQFLFYIRVTSTNFCYISAMYSSDYTAESSEWIPRAYNPPSRSQPHPTSELSGPSVFQPSLRGKELATHSSPSSVANSSNSTPST